MEKQMSAITLESLGFSQEELQERVVGRLCEQVLQSTGYDEDGDEYSVDSKLAKTLERRVKEHVDATINAMAEKHVLPNVSTYIENLTLQTTNRWGERQGKPVTFIEYLTQRAEAYMQEEVDFQGKPKGADSYSWKGTQTRLTHMVHQHLHYSIESAMKDALQIANSAIATGIQETVKRKLAEVSAALKAEVKTK
jgi:predicted metal-dependent hydrolase